MKSQCVQFKIAASGSFDEQSLYQAMYQFYQVLICLLKFDFFAFTGVTIQVGVTLHFTCNFTKIVFCSFSSSFFPKIQPSLD